jgi:hypothetical protein
VAGHRGGGVGLPRGYGMSGHRSGAMCQGGGVTVAVDGGAGGSGVWMSE